MRQFHRLGKTARRADQHGERRRRRGIAGLKLGRAPEFGFGDDEIMQISMAVREGAVNAVLHGNAYAPDKKVTLAFERAGGNLIITIADQGKGMDLSKIPNPLAPENLLKTSGRGIFLMRSFMDVVEIRPTQTGTELKLVKRVHGPTADRKEASQ